jgi:hypothetical protein
MRAPASADGRGDGQHNLDLADDDALTNAGVSGVADKVPALACRGFLDELLQRQGVLLQLRGRQRMFPHRVATPNSRTGVRSYDGGGLLIGARSSTTRSADQGPPLTTDGGAPYAYMEGTSMATPNAAASRRSSSVVR